MKTAIATLALPLLAMLAGCATQPEPVGRRTPQAAAAPAPTPAAAPARKPWDQARMTELTAKLASDVRAVRRAWRQEPVFRDAANPSRRAALQLDQRLRELDQRTTSLSNQVAAGGGFDETLNTARNIRVLLNDIEVRGGRIMTSVWMQERIEPAAQLVDEIAGYYGKAALSATE